MREKELRFEVRSKLGRWGMESWLEVEKVGEAHPTRTGKSALLFRQACHGERTTVRDQVWPRLGSEESADREC